MVYACVVPEDRLRIKYVHHLQASRTLLFTHVHDQPLWNIFRIKARNDPRVPERDRKMWVMLGPNK